jgi:hypothetical protein
MKNQLFLYIRHEPSEEEIKKTIIFVISKRIKLLSINSTKSSEKRLKTQINEKSNVYSC